MARQHYYDRNAAGVKQSYTGVLAASGVTTRWTYTVPAGKNAQHSLLSQIVDGNAIATAGRICLALHTHNGVATANRFAELIHWQDAAGTTIVSQMVTASFFMGVGETVSGLTYSTDTTTHWFLIVSMFTEYDI